MVYYLKTTEGIILDGTGNSKCRGSEGVSGGKIVAVGDATHGTITTIDAEGAVVSSGLVDIHSHFDAQIIWDRMMSISPWHG